MNKSINRARDSEIEQYKNVAFVEGGAFEFAEGKKGISKFMMICDVFAHSEKISTITFQKGLEEGGITFDEHSIGPLLLQKDTLSLICENSLIDRAYFLFRRVTGISFLLIVEKSRCDCIIYYDKRELFEEEAAMLFSELEDEYYTQKRQSFKVIRKETPTEDDDIL